MTDIALLDWLARCVKAAGLKWASVDGLQFRRQLQALHDKGLIFTPEEMTGVSEGLERIGELEQQMAAGARRRSRRWDWRLWR
jgi:hypothetical protein